MDTFKKPYEISLWEDELVWHRRKLSKVQINKDDYEKGKYYSVNPNVKGTPQYWLDTRDFDSSVTYYSLAPISEDNNLEGTKEDIEVPEKSNYWRDANGNLVPQIVLQYYKEVMKKFQVLCPPFLKFFNYVLFQSLFAQQHLYHIYIYQKQFYLLDKDLQNIYHLDII